MDTPMPDSSKPSIGLLIRQKQTVIAAMGLVADLRVQEGLLLRLDEAERRTLFDVQLPSGPCIGITLSDQDLEVTFIRTTDVNGALVDFVATVPFAFDLLDQILNDPYQAITVADHTGTMRYISPVHEKFLGFSHGEAIGKSAEEAIPNSRLRAVIESGNAEIGHPLELSDRVTRVVSRRPIRKDGQIVGAVGQVMFRDAEAMTRMASEMNKLRAQVEFYRTQLDDLRGHREATAELIGESQAMQRLRREVATVARLDVPVLILGESGTGKELVARAIHALGRPQQPLVSLNLAALPSSLIESELFGHTGGAFTGSSKQGRPGKFEQANEGTLFLDEVGDIPMEVQVKLLRVLEERVVERLGSHVAKRMTFRLVTATHRDIEELIETGAFRTDLFYRISGVTLRVPPLRERLEDIPALTQHFVTDFCQRNRLPQPHIDNKVTRYLADQAWPGNLRQLRHRIEEALVFSDQGHLGLEAFLRHASAKTPTLSLRSLTGTPSVGRLIDQERLVALRAVEECDGNKQRAARMLGISRSYLYKLLR